LAVLVAGAAAFVFLTRGGGLPIARALGLARLASPRLSAVVARAAERVGLRPRATYEIPSSNANAFAFPLSGRLAFTTTILDVLDDDELTAVCAHELGHLAEPRALSWCRVAPLLFLGPLAATPLIYAWCGLVPCLALAAGVLVS